MKPLEEREKRERHRREVVNNAVESADRIILNGSDGSTEETNLLTAEAAKELMGRALRPFNSQMLAKDLE